MSHPSIEDLRRRAKRRIPHFVWEYLDSGTGDDLAHLRNQQALDRVELLPDVLGGEMTADMTSPLLGRDYALPFGIAPVGMSGLMWPGAEHMLARAAVEANVPFCLSSMATQAPEDMAGHMGENGWYQLYTPGDPEIRKDMVARVRDAGFRVLVVTVDVPAASRRERQRRADIRQPPAITPKIALQCALRPHWSLLRLRMGMPTLASLAKYADVKSPRPGTDHIGYVLRTRPDWDYLKALRDEWDGPLVVKGVLDPAPARRMVDLGVDALWVSNHGGRQFDAAPAAISALPAVRAAVGPDVPLIFDSGVRSGTDVLRALALGANFVMLGRAFHYGVAAFGAKGAAHVVRILSDSIACDLGQMGLVSPHAAKTRLP